MSDDPNNFTFSTLEHFLIEESFDTILEPNLIDKKVATYHRYRLMLQRKFWTLWRIDYLRLLQKRNELLQMKINLENGDIVRIKDVKLPQLNLLGRIVKNQQSADGSVRVCSVETQSSIYLRSIVKLA